MFEKMKIDPKYVRYGLYIVTLGVFLVLGYKIVDNSIDILSLIEGGFSSFFTVISPIFYGFVLAYLLFRPVMFFQKCLEKIYIKLTKRSFNEKYNMAFRILSIVIIFTIIAMVIKLIIGVILPPIIDNIKILLGNLPDYKVQLNKWIEHVVDILNKNNIDVISTGKVAAGVMDKISIVGNQVLTYITDSIAGIGSFVVNLVLTIIFAVYFIKDKESLFGNFKYFRDVVMPGKIGHVITRFIQDLDEMVGKFLVGAILDSVIVGVVSTVLLLLSNHPFAVLVGCVAGITNIIPYIGPVIGAALAFGLGIFSSWTIGITGAVLLLLYQQVDGNFVQPKIVGGKIGLTPIWILIVVLIGGSYFGALGMILSMPIGGLIRVYFIRYAEYKKRKREINNKSLEINREANNINI